MNKKLIRGDSKSFEIAGEELLLLPQKAIFWKRKKIMLLSDLHLGKVNHFRRSGIPVPPQANQRNIELMIDLFRQWDPLRVIFLGDLFHSHYNQEWEVFGQVLKNFPNISFELVMGNHDIMSEYQYLKHKILIHDPILKEEPFVFSHDDINDLTGSAYLLSGHIHPGVQIKGGGRQRLRLPCFYFGKQKGIMPAFGAFTGIHPINPKPEDKVFVVAQGKIFEK